MLINIFSQHTGAVLPAQEMLFGVGQGIGANTIHKTCWLFGTGAWALCFRSRDQSVSILCFSHPHSALVTAKLNSMMPCSVRGLCLGCPRDEPRMWMQNLFIWGSGVNDVSACDITSAALMHPLCGKLLEAFLAGCCSIMQMGGLLRLRFASCSELVGWGD